MKVFDGNGWTVIKKNDSIIITIDDVTERHPRLKLLSGEGLIQFIQNNATKNIHEFMKAVDHYRMPVVKGNGWIASRSDCCLYVGHNTSNDSFCIRLAPNDADIEKQLITTLSENKTRRYKAIRSMCEDVLKALTKRVVG